MLYPQNGDRFVTTDYVTSLHFVYSHGTVHTGVRRVANCSLVQFVCSERALMATLILTEATQDKAGTPTYPVKGSTDKASVGIKRRQTVHRQLTKPSTRSIHASRGCPWHNRPRM